MAAVQIGAIADMLRKEAQLAGGAATFALQTHLGPAGFLTADPGDGLGPGLDLIGDGVKKGGTLFARGIAIGPEGPLRPGSPDRPCPR